MSSSPLRRSGRIRKMQEKEDVVQTEALASPQESPRIHETEETLVIPSSDHDEEPISRKRKVVGDSPDSETDHNQEDSSMNKRQVRFDHKDFWSIKHATYFYDYFRKRPMAPGRTIMLENLKEVFCDLISEFGFQKWEPLLSLREPIYQDLIRKFYANMRLGPTEGALESLVNGVRIVIDEEILGNILGMSFSGISHVFKGKWPGDFGVDYEVAKSSLIEIPRYAEGKFSVSALNFKHRIIAQIVCTSILPRARSHETLTKRDIFFLYCLVNKHKIKLSDWIINFMFENSQILDEITSLPYGMLLTKVFEFYKVNLTDCPFTKPTGIIDATSFRTMRYKLVGETWVRNEERMKQPMSPSSSNQPSPSILPNPSRTAESHEHVVPVVINSGVEEELRKLNMKYDELVKNYMLLNNDHHALKQLFIAEVSRLEKEMKKSTNDICQTMMSTQQIIVREIFRVTGAKPSSSFSFFSPGDTSFRPSRDILPLATFSTPRASPSILPSFQVPQSSSRPKDPRK